MCHITAKVHKKNQGKKNHNVSCTAQLDNTTYVNTRRDNGEGNVSKTQVISRIQEPQCILHGITGQHNLC